MRLSLSEIVKACGGRILNDFSSQTIITGVSTNTKTIKTGDIFVPIKGERFDGHDYLNDAFLGGAVCAFTERTTKIETTFPLIYVNSTRRALMDLASYYRRIHDVKVIAVTGSAGKTTTKDMIAEIMSKKYKTKKTMGNFNNDIGLPLSIFQLEQDDQVLVLEMGMNHANEIHDLSLTGAPDISIITHIGDAHIENFENREGILNAKLEIVDGLKPNGTVILNGDDPLLTGDISKEKTESFNVLYPNSNNILESTPNGLNGSECIFKWKNETIRIEVPMPGNHMVKNALLAVVCGLEMGITPEDITEAFNSFTPPDGRLTVIESKGIKIIKDVYNSNPAAKIEAIKILEAAKTDENRVIAILGDMGELGHVAEERHFEVGEFAAKSNVDILVAIGTLSKNIYHGFTQTNLSGNAEYFETVEEFLPHCKSFFKPNDVVLIKASRSMKFEQISNELIHPY